MLGDWELEEKAKSDRLTGLLERIAESLDAIAAAQLRIADSGERQSKLIAKLVMDGRGALLVQNRGNR